MRPFMFASVLFAIAGTAIAADRADTPEKPCRETAGAEKSKTLVEQCLEVSPATHPPCNAANACALIVDEITRGCALIEKDAPKFCSEYANTR